MKRFIALVLMICLVITPAMVSAEGGFHKLVIAFEGGFENEGDYMAFVDNETYENNDCHVAVAAVPETCSYTFQTHPDRFVPYFTLDNPKMPFTYDVTGEWECYRKIDKSLEEKGYIYYKFTVISDTTPAILEELTQTYQYDGETYYVLEPNQWYKYIKIGDLDDDGMVDVCDMVSLRNSIMGESDTSMVMYADFDKDGALDVSDVVATRNVIMGR